MLHSQFSKIKYLLLIILLISVLGFSDGPNPIFLPMLQSHTALPAAPGVYLLRTSSANLVNNSLHITGEIINKTSSSVSNIKITANLLDEAGQVLTTVEVYTLLNNIPYGEGACFDAVIHNPPVGWKAYTFDPVTYGKGGSALTGLNIYGQSGVFDEASQAYQIAGSIRNDRMYIVKHVSVVATVYKQGQVVGCETALVNDTDTNLNPGQSGKFKFTLYLGQPTSYKLRADGAAQ